MLDPQRISMGRVRQAYALNANEVENVIQALWPGDVFPLELWKKADEKFWRGSIYRNAALYNTINMPLPTVDAPHDKFFNAHICVQRIETFFNELIFILLSRELKVGFNYILDETFNENSDVFIEERKVLFDKLYRIEKIHNLYTSHAATKEEFIAALEEKKISIPPNSRFFIADIICDTLVVDKATVIRHLSTCGFPLLHEVKGITHSLVESILNPPSPEIPTEPETTVPPVELATEVQPQKPQDAISVRRSLWVGKIKEAICADMRKENFDNEFIAHVLLHKRGLKLTQREVGKLLGPPHKSESKYDKLGKELCQKAALVSVIDAPEP